MTLLIARMRYALVAIPVLLASSAPVRAAAVLSVSVPGTASVGQQVTADVNISGVSSLYSFQFDLDFTPGVLEATSESEGTFLPSGGTTFFIQGVPDNSTGTVSDTADTLVSLLPGVSGSGTLAALDFTGLTTGHGTFTLANVILLNSSLNPIPFTTSGAEISVQGGGAVPEPISGALVGPGLLALGLAVIRKRR